MPPAAAIDVEEARQRLERVGQEHVLTFFDELSAEEQNALLDQVAQLPLERLPEWTERYVKSPGPAQAADEAAAGAQPPNYYPADPSGGEGGRSWDCRRVCAAGEELVRAGKVAAFTVAGGQGSRLGFDGPKGKFPATPILRKPLFRVLAEQLVAAQRKFGAPIAWYIMTSPLNHAETVSFFNEHAYFGLDPEQVMFFPQGLLPSLDAETGRLLLAGRGEIATNPDGHGGSLKALHVSGALDDMRRRGVEHISYTQIDNPLVKLIDPIFIGLHAVAEDSSAEMSSKMVAKTEPAEKVGVFGVAGGRMHVIEYSNLSEDQAAQREPDGRLRFNAGNIACHMLSVAFVESLNRGADGDFSLPLHRAVKKVPHIDPETGEPVDPDTPNAVKLESFVFDALPLCESSVVYEVERVEEFAPIKNAEGADSPATSRALQIERAARWLERIGASPPRKNDGAPDCVIELSPLAALEPADLEGRDLPQIKPGEQVVID